jgi:hypothetical protein
MSPRAVRVNARLTWLLLVANTLYLFACPALVLAEVLPERGSHLEYFDFTDTEVVTDALAHGDWDWDWQVWLVPLLAVVLPALLHRRLRNRIGDPFRVTRQLPEHAAYRGAGLLRVEVDSRLARRCSAAYLTRLALAAALCAIPWFVLLHTYIWSRHGCYPPLYIRTVPEHMTFAAILLATILWHCPLPARILGRAPRLLPASR